ncbi:MAG: hypothetical protein K6U74_16360, partial [Firmicutes bacterium]|nr:hypothetical protein [Bacillota bacterium]
MSSVQKEFLSEAARYTHGVPRPVSITGYFNLKEAAAVILLAAADLASLTAALSAALLIRVYILPGLFSTFPRHLPKHMFNWLVLMVAVTLLCLAYEGLYTKRFPFWRETKRIVKAAVLAFFLMLGVVSLGKLSASVSRTFIVLAYVSSAVSLPLGRL